MTLDANQPSDGDIDGTTPEIDPATEPAEDLAASPEGALAADAEPESTEEADSEASTTGRKSKLQKLIDSKYGGNEDKFADAIFEQWNSSSRLHDEIKELKGMLAKPEPEVEEPDISPDAHPDYQWLKSEITALESDANENLAYRNRLLQEYHQIDRDIARMEGELLKADDFDKSKLEQRKWQREQDKMGLEGKWQNSLREDRRVTREKSILERQLKQVEGSVQNYKVQQKQRMVETLQEQKAFISTFHKAVDTAAESKGIPSDSDAREHMFHTIRAEAIVYLQRLPKDQPGVLPEDFVAERAEAYFKAMQFAGGEAYRKMSAQRKPSGVTKLPNAPQIPAARPSRPGAPVEFKTAKDAVNYTKRMLG